MTETRELPRWDLTSLLPPVADPAFRQAFDGTRAATRALVELFDRHAVGEVPAPGEPRAEVFEEVLSAFLDTRSRSHLLEAGLECLTAADSHDDVAQGYLSELQPDIAALGLLQTRLTAWCGQVDSRQLQAASSLAADHAFFLERSAERARHLMSPAEERMAAELAITGSTAWERLHANLTSQILVPVTINGQEQRLPMSAVRNLAQDPDRAVRQHAYQAELAAWEEARLPLAAALNSIKGEVNLLTGRRRWSSPLEATVFDHAIDRPILEAMMAAIEQAYPDFRRYLKAKARRLGLSALAWYDLYAPLGGQPAVWTYEQAAGFIAQVFAEFSPALGETARVAFGDGWIDAGPRPGKVGGAFCMWMRDDQSRILSNYLPTHHGMLTLAHELGHAYHNRLRAGRTILQRRTPSTLAETASIFCETLVDEAAYRRADDQQKVEILEAFLQSACAVLVDVPGRFYFEQAIFERRQARELSADELCEQMREAQRRTYGNGLDAATYHPYMWAVKPHYYSAAASYYNYPYSFGLLFGLGLFAIGRQQPDGFADRYQDLLSRTGMATAADLADGFGLDLSSTEFWTSSLDVIRERIDEFDRLAG